MNNICVFCGSSVGNLPIYEETAVRFGKLLARNGLSLVYGGGKLGLMGIIADAVLEEDGNVIGVIPEFMMDKEVAHRGLTELHITRSMHERKYVMAEISDAFAVLPGGLGTLDEMAEILTWNQLLILKKPIGILNVNNYYESLLNLLDSMVENGFLRPRGRELLIDRKDEQSLLDAFKKYAPGHENIWDSIKRG